MIIRVWVAKYDDNAGKFQAYRVDTPAVAPDDSLSGFAVESDTKETEMLSVHFRGWKSGSVVDSSATVMHKVFDAIETTLNFERGSLVIFDYEG